MGRAVSESRKLIRSLFPERAELDRNARNGRVRGDGDGDGNGAAVAEYASFRMVLMNQDAFAGGRERER